MAGVKGRGRGESESSPRRVTAKERQARAMRLRITGATYQQIADELGYRTPGAARDAIQSAMQATIQEPADEYRALHRERLLTLLRHAMPGVMAGVARSIEVARGVLDSLAKLDGLDAPKRIRFEDDLEAETRAMAVQAGLDPDEAVEDVREMLRQQQKAT